MSSTALPPNPFNSERQPAAYLAYSRCLDLEIRHERVQKTGKLAVDTCARFLGYLLILAPAEQGYYEAATEISRCGDDEALQQLGELYKDHLIRSFLSPKGLLPGSSDHPSAASFTTQKQQLNPTLQTTPKNYTSAKKRALKRDGYRCVITGRLDQSSVGDHLVKDNGQQLAETQACHILSKSTNQGLEGAQKRNYAATVHTLLHRYGQIDPAELDGDGVHSLKNIITLDPTIHSRFDRLDLWLERMPNDPPNQYRSAASQACMLRNVPETITLTTPNPSTHPLPDPRYLALHAACARIIHKSGAAPYIRRVLCDIEEMGVLDTNGSSVGSDALYHALILCSSVEVY